MKDNKKIVFGIGIAFLFLVTIGFSYAYFTATLVNKDVKNQVVETGTLSLVYTDGMSINGKNISPGWKATKTITIENTGTLDAFYTIFWKDLVNEITNDELVMSLECESSTDTCATINFENQTVPSIKSEISQNIIIYPGEIQTITLNFEFKELNKSQDYNQGKKFNGVINIEDSTKLAFQTEYTMYTRVIDQNDNPLANITIELQSDSKNGITDENGYVRISGIVSGKHELFVKDSEGNTLDTKNIEITQKKESDVINDSTIYVDSSLKEFTNTIKLNSENKLESISNLIIPPDECFGVSNNAITGYYSSTNDKCPKELIIPSKINGTIITSLEREYYICSNSSRLFEGQNLKKVIIPDTIEKISSDAFRNNQLTNISIPNSVKNIGNGVFNNNQLEDSQAFIYNRNTDGSEDTTTIVSYGGWNKNVKIPSGVMTIDSYSFQNNNLINITIPDSVTSIGYGAFQNNKLTSVTIPNSITSIDDYAFRNNKLINIIIPDSVTSIGDCAFKDNNLISLTISNEITKIGSSVFSNNNLTSVTIPDSVTSIGYGAFQDNKLTSVTIPDSVTSIEYYAFAYNKLTSVTIPNSVKNIGYGAFQNNKLTSIVIPNTITSIENYVFRNNNLTNITIPNSVTSIGNSAFANNELTSVTIPNSVTTIKDSAFENNNLVNITIPDSVTSMGNSVFSKNKLPESQAYIYARKSSGGEDKTTLIGYGGKDKDITIPNGVKKIKESSFANNELTSVIIPNSVTSIGYYAFANNKLTSLTIPNSVTSIDTYAFQNNNLISLTIENGLISIGRAAFQNNKLTSVIIPSSVTSIGENAFRANKLTSLTISSGVTSIGNSAFSDNNLTSITIPDSVTTLGNYAFSNNNLTNVILSNKITSIGIYTFLDNNLTSITIPNSVTSIGESAFSNNNLASIIIPDSVTSIGRTAFANNNLASITIPDSVTSIERSAFNNNELPDSQAFIYKRNTDGSEDKTTIVSYGGKNKNPIIPNEVLIIDSYSFSSCNLTNITIPNSVTSIESSAFANNDLSSVTIPKSVTYLGYAFSNNKLKQVIIQGKSSSSEFTTYSHSWGWASDVTCVKDNTRNVTNGCITWGA